MKRFNLLFLIVLSLFIFSGTVKSQVTVSGSTGADGPYTTLTGAAGAFNAINLGVQTGNNIVVSITADASAETGAVSLNAGAWTSLVISPSGGALRNISGDVAGALITLDGADNVTINGLNSGGNSLVITNINTGLTAATIKLINDASSNSILQCTILGSGTSTGTGTVWYSTGTTTGNIGNSLQSNLIGPAGVNLPVNGVASLGTSLAVPNTVSMTTNNIFDYFNAGGTSCGVLINANNTGWTLTGNKFYQTATRVYTTAATHYGVQIAGGSGYTVSGNTFGFANSSGSGTTNMIGNSVDLAGFPASYVASGTANATRYIALSCTFAAAGTNSTISTNIVGGYALYTSSNATTINGIFCGIMVGAGNATVDNNQIGSTSGTGSIYTACSVTGGTVVGIYSTSVNTVAVTNNTFGAIDASGTTATTSGGFTGIDCAGTLGSHTISGNTIGNATADNIRTGYMLSAGNLSNAGTLTSTTGATAAFIGIRNSSTGPLSITNNTFRGLNIGGTVTTHSAIINSGAVTTSNTIDGNFLGTAGLDWMRYAFANSGALIGISAGTATVAAATLSISNNTYRGLTYSVNGTGANTYLTFGHATSTTSTINGNQWLNMNVATSGAITFMTRSGNMTATGVCKFINNSVVTGFTKSAANGTVTFMSANSSSVNGSQMLDTNNVFSNITVSGTSGVTGWSDTEGASSSNGPTKTIRSNIISNISNGSGAFLGMSVNFSGTGTVVTHNTISGVTMTGTSAVGISLGTSHALTGTLAVTHNRILNIEGSNAAGLVTGILVANGGTLNCFNNIIGDLRNPLGTNATVPPVDVIRGIGITSTVTVTTLNISNNTVYLNAAAGGANFSTSAIFHTTNATATTATLVLRNNIFFNMSIVNGTGSASAYRRSSTTLTNFSSTSGKNNYYASGAGKIFFDGTNSETTLSGYKTRVTPADQTAINENTTFLSTSSASADFMKVDPTIASECESNATTISGIVDDNFYIPRYPNVGYPFNPSYPPVSPDIGANEFGGIPIDLSGPGISYTALTNTSSTGDRSLVATITDITGVPTAGALQPRIYFRKNAGAYVSLQGVLTTGNGQNGTWTFSIDESDMGGVAPSDVIGYYVIAQDLSVTPNISSSPGGVVATDVNTVTTPPTPNTYNIVAPPMSGDFTVGVALFRQVTGINVQFETRTRKVMKEVPIEKDAPANKNSGDDKKERLFGEAYAPGESKMIEVDESYAVPMVDGKEYNAKLYHELTKAEKRQYNLSDNMLGIYATLTAAATDVNLRGVGASDCRLLLNDAVYNIASGETFPVQFNSTTQLPTSASKLIIKPNTGIVATIGDASTSGILVSRAPYVVFDGTAVGNTGTRDLTVTNTSATTGTYCIGLFNNTAPNKADNNTIQYCNITGGATTASTALVFGIILNAAGGDYDNVSINNNVITSVRTGMQIAGVSGFTSDNCTINNNTVGSTTEASSCFFQGILVSFCDNAVIRNNELIGHVLGDVVNGQTGTPTGNICAIPIVSSTNTKVRANNIHDWYFAGTTQGYGAFGIAYNFTGNNTGTTEISNNLVYQIKGDGDVEGSASTSMGFLPVGICIFANGTSAVQIYYNSVYMSGNTLGASFNGSSACLGVAGTVGVGSMDVRNNIFRNDMMPIGGVPNPLNNETMGIWVASAVSNNIFSNINYNNYYGNGNLPNAGYFTTLRALLTDWQTASGQDAASIYGVTPFTGVSDLTIDAASANAWNVSGNGVPISTIAVDYTGAARSVLASTGATDLGAYNVTPSSPVPTIVIPVAGVGAYPIVNNGRTIGTVNITNVGSLDMTPINQLDVKYTPGGDPPGAPPALHFSNAYWEITPNVGAAGFAYDITLNYTDGILGTCNVSNLRMAKSDNAGALYTPYLVAGTNPGEYELDLVAKTVKVYGLTTFSLFALTDSDSPLPVELASFTSSIDRRSVTLKWSTASELNNSGFDVERKSIGTENSWSKVGSVAGAGSSTTIKNYSFTENNLNTGKYNYRLKQIDFNGNFRYYDLSGEVIIGVPSKFEISQNYPNPFNPSTKINFDLPFDSKVQIKIFDITGREVFQLVNEARTAGYHTVQFNASSMASGVYFYMISANGGNQSYAKTMKMVLVK